MKKVLPLLLVFVLTLCGCTQAAKPATQSQIDEITAWYEQLVEDNNNLQQAVNENIEEALVLRCQAFSARLAALGERFSDTDKLCLKAYCDSIKNEECELSEELNLLKREVQQQLFDSNRKNLAGEH